MSQAQFEAALSAARTPVRVPSDLAALESADPMTHSLRHLGGQARVDAAHARAIKHLIASALRGE